MVGICHGGNVPVSHDDDDEEEDGDDHNDDDDEDDDHDIIGNDLLSAL